MRKAAAPPLPWYEDAALGVTCTMDLTRGTWLPGLSQGLLSIGRPDGAHGATFRVLFPSGNELICAIEDPV